MSYHRLPAFTPPDELIGMPSISATDTYRGWTITRGRWPAPEWIAFSPNYDASWEGEEDGWIDNGEKAYGPTRDVVLDEIDAWFEEHLPSDSDRSPEGGDTCGSVHESAAIANTSQVTALSGDKT